jgi:uncharacterized protein YndB with AHSA1/START domain
MKQLTVNKTIEINAPASKVWDVLTNRELTKEYMFDCELISDCKLGNPIIWKGASDDKVYVKGTITGITPGKLLQFTVFDPNAADHYEDVPSNYTTVTYELSSKNGRTALAVRQGDFTGVTNGEKRYNETIGGWDFILPKIKELAEK